MPKIEYRARPEDAGRTVKALALKELRLSRGLFSSLKFSGGLLLDGETVRSDTQVRPGQTLTLRWEEKAAYAPPPGEADFSVAWEDAHYFILDKGAPLSTLSSPRQAGPSLESGLYTRLGCPEGFVFRPVNRLDKGTSGLLAAAKSAHAQQRLQRLLHTDGFLREYLALCRGRLPEARGAIEAPIGKGEGVRREVRTDGRPAVTHYQVEAASGDVSLVRLRLETGRTHQIRVHLAHLGCPILGDYLYGAPDPRLPGRFALHSCRLAFRHPFTGQEISLSSPLPKDWEKLL